MLSEIKFDKSDFEASIEIDPRRTKLEQLKTLYDMGFNRVSLGVQDFNEEVQKLINRVQPYEMTKELTDGARAMGYQSVNFDDVHAPLVGLGLFWARPMPRIFDSILNVVPFLRYPKFVDMDFVYFLPSSIADLDSQVTADNNWALNFHGKILWTPQLFAELGTGVKQYGFIDFNARQQVSVTLAYLTVGLGYSF